MEKFLHKFDDVAQVANTGSDNPLTLEGADRSWIVAEGNVDVFLTGLDPARKAVGARVHIARIQHGGVLLGMDFSRAPDDTGAAPSGYVAVGVPGTKLLEVPLKNLLARAADLARSQHTCWPYQSLDQSAAEPGDRRPAPRTTGGYKIRTEI